MEINKKPSDYKPGDHITFHDPHVNQSLSGIIREIESTIESDGHPEWSEVMIRIETPNHGWATFYTDLLAETNLYWFGGDPESECTPEERGCYLISEHYRSGEGA